jgi:selenide,water dikinase
VLGDLSVPDNDRVLVDYRTSDDAGVYKLDDGRALVQTVDFFTPIVDDPFEYGQIAAANALSDVYAMGGRPLTALAIAAFPRELPGGVISAIFRGGQEMLQSAGVPLLGGHTVQDREIKFGYAVTGEVHPERIWVNAGARPGDVLVMTKAIGTGVIATAIKAGRAPDASVAAAISSMLTLNRAASEALQALPAGAIHACTDVTGFGLIGHVSEIAAASGVTIEIRTDAVPLLPGALELVERHVSAGGRTNEQHFGPAVKLGRDLEPNRIRILYDPQTSGGLLMAVHPDHAETILQVLRAAAVQPYVVGRALDRSASAVLLV